MSYQGGSGGCYSRGSARGGDYGGRGKGYYGSGRGRGDFSGRGGGDGGHGGRGGGRGGGRSEYSGGGSSSSGSYQAPALSTPYTPPQGPMRASSSLSKEFKKKINMQPLPTVAQPSSKAIGPPRRPGFGTIGRKCIVKANHFLVQVKDE